MAAPCRKALNAGLGSCPHNVVQLIKNKQPNALDEQSRVHQTIAGWCDGGATSYRGSVWTDVLPHAEPVCNRRNVLSTEVTLACNLSNRKHYACDVTGQRACRPMYQSTSRVRGDIYLSLPTGTR